MIEYPVKYNDNNYVIMANNIIKGKQEMSLQEARLVRLLIMQIAKEDKDLKTYTIKICELAEFLGIYPNNMYRDVQKLCDSIIGKKIRVGTDNPKQPWKTFVWVQLAEYDGKGNLTMMLSNEIQKYVLALNAWFTKYRYKDILNLNSFYALRLYELLKTDVGINKKHDYKNVFDMIYTMEYLRTFFGCENKFLRIPDFRRYVIDICVREINEKSDLLLEVEYVKTSRAITSIRFFVQEKDKTLESKQQEVQEQDIPQYGIPQKETQDIKDLCLELKGLIKEPMLLKDLKAILKLANNDIDLVLNKYKIAQQQQDITNLTAWLVKAIQENYEEPVKTQFTPKTKKTNHKQNRFVNFKQRDWDFDELERLEREYIKKNLENTKNEIDNY